jgi:hypothetical protein
VDVIALEEAADIGLVGRACTQPLDRGFFIPEGEQEGEGELGRVERLARQLRYGLLDLDSVHGVTGWVTLLSACSWQN